MSIFLDFAFTYLDHTGAKMAARAVAFNKRATQAQNLKSNHSPPLGTKPAPRQQGKTRINCKSMPRLPTKTSPLAFSHLLAWHTFCPKRWAVGAFEDLQLDCSIAGGGARGHFGAFFNVPGHTNNPVKVIVSPRIFQRIPIVNNL